MSSALDSLKDAFWSVKNHLDYVADHLAGQELLEDGHHVYDMLDSTVGAVTEALGQHVPGVSYIGFPQFTEEAWQAARTYDDGSPVIVAIQLEHGSVADFRPRHDGDLEAFKAQFKPVLYAVEGVGA